MATRDYRTLKLEILAETKQFVDDMKKGEKQVQTFGDRVAKFGAAAKAAFIAAAAAAAAYAGKLAIDGVKAAIADEAAQKRLEVALKNVTNATDSQIAAVEKQISKFSLAFGVADDNLRPAFQRLATATGSLEKANEGLSLALDISAATGKSLEAVSNALGKAYEGNTSALSRLGIGLSSAEIKTLGLDGTMKQLAQTFGGSATQQAETFQGRVNRLNVAFDEAKEAIGFALLPILTRLLEYITNTVIPAFQDFKTKAIDPVINSIKNNKAALRSLYDFGKLVLEPYLRVTLFSAIEGLSTVANGIVQAVGIALRALEPIINAAITGINAVIRAKNLLLGGNTATIGAVDFSTFGLSNVLAGLGNRPLGSNNAALLATVSALGASVAGLGAVSGGKGGSAGGGGGGGSNKSALNALAKIESDFAELQKLVGILSGEQPSVAGTYGAFQPVDKANISGGAAGGIITINVNAPSAIDETGFTRAVVDALNSVERRQAGGASALINL